MRDLTKEILQLDEALSEMSKAAQALNEAVEKEARDNADALMQAYKEQCNGIREASTSSRTDEQGGAVCALESGKTKLLSVSEREALAREIFLQIREHVCTLRR